MVSFKESIEKCGYKRGDINNFKRLSKAVMMRKLMVFMAVEK
jgi:hypothetical protein